MERNSRRYGFTLVELSIALVIIGLLVSGIMAGRSLIEAGEVRKVVSGMSELETAINLFVDTYDYLPGDFPNATDYWGTSTSNGNGDHKYPTSDSPTNKEGHYGFHHLGLAGMYQSFERPDTGAKTMTPGLTAPELMSGSSLIFQYRNAFSGWGASDRYDIHKPYLQFAAPSSGEVCSAIVSPQTARAIDLKMDDGHASTGRAVTYRGCSGSPNCTTSPSGSEWSSTPGQYDYMLSNDDIRCRMAFFIFPPYYDNR